MSRRFQIAFHAGSADGIGDAGGVRAVRAVRGKGRCAAGTVAAVAMLAGLLMFTAHASFAQDAQKRAARARTVRTELNRIIPLMRTDPQRAVVELQELVREYPEEHQLLYERLGYAYTVASMPDSAIAAYEACVAMEPMPLSAARELAQLYITRGRKEDAERLFSDMLNRAPNRLAAYRMVMQAQVAAGWQARALETCRRAREELNSPDAFAVDIGDLEKMAGNMGSALEEYLRYLGSKDAEPRGARQKILDLARDPRTNRNEIVTSLETRSQSGDAAYRRRVLEVLSQMYLEDNLLEKALEAGLAADGLAESNGQGLYGLIQQLCGRYDESDARGKARLMDLCLRASDAYLSRHPKTAEAPAVSLTRATALVERCSGRYEPVSREERSEYLASAVAGLQSMMKRFPGTKFRERAMLLEGDINLRYLDKEEALRIYRSGMQGATEYPGEFAEKTAKAYCALGRFDEGKQYCSMLMRSKKAPLADTGFYYMGVMLACTGAYEAARDTLTALAEHRPASAYTNDAIDLAWALELGLRLDPDHLAAYGSVMAAELAGDSTAVLRGLEAFADMPAGTPLRPRQLFKLGVWYDETGAYEKALSTLSDFLDEYPDDALAPEAERRMGEIYEQGLGDTEQALKRYEHVLMVYPAYVFLDEVRQDVVRLRGTERTE
jgi:tetratricopeptide (TPR) repeat protein